jgi:hypothetical protein
MNDIKVIATIKSLDLSSSAQRIIYTAPASMQFVITSLVFRTVNFGTPNISNNTMRDGGITLSRERGDLLISSFTVADVTSDSETIRTLATLTSPLLAGGDNIKFFMNSLESGSDILVDLDIIGYAVEGVVTVQSHGITTKEAIENYLLTTIDPSFEYQLNDWIAGVEQEMNRLTDRQLIAGVIPVTCKYDGNHKASIMIDDFVSISKVEVDGDDITSSCFFYPANSTPKWRVETSQKFNKGRQNVSITGLKGFTTLANLPLDLKQAATVLVAGIINFSNQSEGEIKSESIGRYSVTYTTDSGHVDFDKSLAAIKAYRRIR